MDPGVNTGLACYDKATQKLIRVETTKLHTALIFLYVAHHGGQAMHVFIEDARRRRWIPVKDEISDRARLQGAGSIKRDCNIIEDALIEWKIPYTLVAPRNNKTKTSAEEFKRITGWEGRTSNHARDAAMLLIGR
jgi:hypothetical protein